MMFSEPRDSAFPLDGGVDLVSSHLIQKPGRLIAGSNIQMAAGRAGYGRVGGYERCTDDTMPSETKILFFVLDSPSGAIAVGDQFSSGGKSVRALDAITSPQTDDVLAVATHDSEFTPSSAFTGPTTFTLDSILSDTSGYSDDQLMAYRKQAIEQTRSNIPALPGSGDVNGGFRLDGKVYAFRDGKMYRGDAFSWTEIAMPQVMYFDSGIKQPAVGDTITDGTATAVIASITRQSGAWNYELDDSERSAGYFTLSGVSGSFSGGLTIQGDTVPAITNNSFDTDTDWTKGTGWSISGGAAVCSGAQTANSDLSIDYSVSRHDVVELAIVVSGVTAGTLTPIIGTDEGEPITANGSHNITIAVSVDADTLHLRADSDFAGSVESITPSVGEFAQVKTANTAYTLPAGGRYETRKENFTNLEGQGSVYGVSGVGEAFEFDGTNYIPIFIPEATTFPKHINIHQDRLVLVFPGGQALSSVNSEPRVFNSLLGAYSHSSRSEIVSARTIHGNAEAVLCKGSTWLLTGNGLLDETTQRRNHDFFEHDPEIGAEEWSVSGKSFPIFMSSGEIRMIVATDDSSLYQSVPIAEEIQPFLKDKDGTVAASIFSHDENQYRLFFQDGSGVFLTFHGNKYRGATFVSFPAGISCTWRTKEGGKEYIYFASDTGYVYRMDSGNTHDDKAIKGSFRVPFYHYGSPRISKRFPEMVLELDAPVLLTGDTTITFTVNYNYGSPKSPRPLANKVTDIDGAGGLYGNNDGYGNFVWSGPIVSELHAYLDGEGANMSILVVFETRYDMPFTFLTAIVDYIPLGRARKG